MAMKSFRVLAIGASALLVSGALALADIKVVVDYNDGEHSSAAFKFKSVPLPAPGSASSKATFTIIDGEKDENGGDLDKLHDGKLPSEEDAPADNFFFAAGTDGGQLVVDLGDAIDIKQINTYSWHPNTRGPQVYKLYASDGKGDGFNAKAKSANPEKSGWKLISSVDTRPKDGGGSGGGQYGVSISDSAGSVGKYRYLLFAISKTEDTDVFGNTFYSEIDVVGSGAAGATAAATGDVKVTIGHNDNEHSTAAFKFKTVPSPNSTNAARQATFAIVDGEKDENGGDLDKLHDGKLPSEEDAPADNFFFAAGTDGGRLSVDLGRVIGVRQVNTYSWHPNTRGPQVYKLYASDGTAGGFNAQPKNGTDPVSVGWKLITSVDTRPKEGDGGGQYGVSIAGAEGPLGRFRYLLFVISKTEDTDTFGNTFFSEIDVVGANRGGRGGGGGGGGFGNNDAPISPTAFVTHSVDNNYCEIVIDTSGAPKLKDWAETKLAPVLAEWYPKITKLLASDGFVPPKRFTVSIRPGNGVAATGGTRVTANSDWLERELQREAVGSIVHEEVHVVQAWGGARRNNPNATRSPGWLQEGIPDYIRWYLYEPQTKGTEITKRNFDRARYDGLYRISANFLNYVVEKYGIEIITKVNALCREGRYTDQFWKDTTGKTINELNDDWKAGIAKKLGITAGGGGDASAPSTAADDGKPNMLSAAEKAAGWQLLFDGKDFDGWHNFKKTGVQAGWQVKDGSLVCVDPHNAGDIVTTGKYDWFELQLDYNISEAGNSGIMFHVTDAGGAVWATGPEFQLEDNVKAADPVRCGWLYALYQPPIDEKTGKTLDATKPVGEWNHVRLLISKDKCVHEINGVKYFEYVLGSDDFKSRVAKSKFGRMKDFAKADSGYIALQGDHGSVSFRNIKILPLQPKS